MNRPIDMLVLAVALMMSIINLLKGLALAILGGIATTVGTQAGGDMTITAGLILATSALCTWAFANAIWNSRPGGRIFGLVAEGFALLGAALNIMQGSKVNQEIVGIVVAFMIIAYLMMLSMRKISVLPVLWRKS